MTAIAARAEVDAARTLRLAVPCDLPPGPVDVVVQVPATGGDGLPADLAAAVASLGLLTDEELWQAARGRLADEASARLAELNDLRQRAGLSAAEAAEADALARQYEWAVLIRARAAALLRARGRDVAGLLRP
jgi:hypothetical protein